MMYVRLFISNPTMELQSGSISISSRDVGNGWAGWEIAHPGLAGQLTLSQPEGAYCAPHINACPPSFRQLPTSLSCLKDDTFFNFASLQIPYSYKKSIEEISYPIVCINSICCGKYIFLRLLFCINKKMSSHI